MKQFLRMDQWILFGLFCGILQANWESERELKSTVLNMNLISEVMFKEPRPSVSYEGYFIFSDSLYDRIYFRIGSFKKQWKVLLYFLSLFVNISGFFLFTG